MAPIRGLSWLLPFLLTVHGLTVVTVPPPTKIIVKEFEEEFYHEFKIFNQWRLQTDRLKEMKSVLMDTQENIALEELPKAIEPLTCLQCRTVSHTFLRFNETKSAGQPPLSQIALDLCSYLSLVPESMCSGIVTTAQPTVEYILNNSTAIDADRVCSIYFQHLNCGESDKLNNEFPVNFPIPEPPIESKRYTKTLGSADSPPLVIVHLSDFHFDPYYEPGSEVQCGEAVCCRGKAAAQGKAAAGFWGEYLPCDSPWHTVEDIVQRVKMEYKNIDMVYYTGDTVDHFSWQTSIEHNSASIRRMTEYLKKEFPNIPLYPVLGNHEGHPSNSFAPSYAVGGNVSSQWLFDLIYDQWGPLLPEGSARETLKSGGHYSVEIRPKLRLIAINNNFCYHSNLWLFHSTDYFADQLHWFRNELAEAEERGDKVHIIAHIPTNDILCFKPWAQEYRKLVEEFHDTIQAVFNGHTHEDEFNVYYSQQDPSKATGVAFNGGSGTTFAFFNSNFKVYYVDPDTYEVLNYDTWHYNLTEANLTPKSPPRWQKTYSFKEAYNVTDMSPSSLDGLVQRLATDRDLLRTYWERKEKYSDYMLKKGCDDKCLRDNFCMIVLMVHGDTAKCDSLYPKSS